jgi:autotransporter-associated beta strand protein
LVTTVSSTSSVNNTEIFLKLGTPNALPTNTVLTLDGGIGTGTGVGRYCELNLNGNNQTVAGLTNVPDRALRVQRVVNSSATASTLTVNNAADYTFRGQLGWFAGQNGTSAYNNFGLAKSGPATLTLSGANAYTGHTTISGGTLAVGGAGGLGNGSYAGNITNNAAFNCGSSATQILSGVISGSGSLTNSGPGVLTITGTDSLPLNIANGGTFSVSGSGNVAGSVSVNAGATLSVAGGGSVSGQVNINAGGTLSLTGGGRVNAVTVNNSGTVSLPGTGIVTNLTFNSAGTMSFDFSAAATVGSLTVAAANGITHNGAANSVSINIK